jgi:hypothetical protein
MDYKEMDQEFAQLVKRTFKSGMEVEIIFEALATMQSHPYASPKLALQIGLNEWDK